MFCGNCGKKNEEGARFCEFCGSPMTDGPDHRPQEDVQAQPVQENPGEQKPVKKKGKRWIWAAGAAAILIIALIVAGTMISREREEKKRYDSALASGDRYLDEMDYEKAEDSYLTAISIDPKQKEPYLGLVDTYIAMEEFDQVVETAEQAKKELPEEEHQEFDDIIDKWSNVTEYTWEVEPEVDIDDITYVYAGDDGNSSANEEQQQNGSEYAVFEKDGLLGIIRNDGTVAVEAEYTNIILFSDGRYLMKRDEPKYEPAFDKEWNTYFFDEETEEITPAEGLGGGFPSGTYYYCGGLHNTDEAYEYLDYQFKEPGSPIPVQQADELFNGFGQPSDWLEGMYAIYSDGALTTDFIYEECGSESWGLFAAKKDGKWGYITADGTEVIPFEYDESWKSDIGGGKISYCYAFSEGYVPLVKDGVWEMRDTSGNVVIPAGLFEAIRPVYDGKCWVQKNGKWGVIRVKTAVDGWMEDLEEMASDEEEMEEEEIQAKSEEELRAALSGNTSERILNFEYTDYDGDGVSEAFAVTSPQDYDGSGKSSDADIWYIDCEGNCTQVMSGTTGSLYEQKLAAGQQEFIVWHGPDTVSYVFGVRDNQPYEPEISGKYMFFWTVKYDDAIYTGTTSDNRHPEFVFDRETGEFVEM